MITLSQAIIGWQLDADARRLSPHTIADYRNSYKKFSQAVGDPPLNDITLDMVRAFFAEQTDWGKKSMLNARTALSALWEWAIGEGQISGNVIRKYKPPRPEQPAIVPFTRDDVRRLLHSAAVNVAHTANGKTYTRTNPNAARNKAVILLLLDTGARASEVCDLRIRFFDARNRQIRVYGKGDKERLIPFSPSTGQAVYRYLMTRPTASIDAPLFVSDADRPILRRDLLHTLVRIGQAAGVADVHPHRFRHTFAITYLRNGASIFALQAALGHTSLDMCRRYLAIAQADVDAAHRIASPVANWNL